MEPSDILYVFHVAASFDDRVKAMNITRKAKGLLLLSDLSFLSILMHTYLFCHFHRFRLRPLFSSVTAVLCKIRLLVRDKRAVSIDVIAEKISGIHMLLLFCFWLKRSLVVLFDSFLGFFLDGLGTRELIHTLFIVVSLKMREEIV